MDRFDSHRHYIFSISLGQGNEMKLVTLACLRALGCQSVTTTKDTTRTFYENNSNVAEIIFKIEIFKGKTTSSPLLNIFFLK